MLQYYYRSEYELGLCSEFDAVVAEYPYLRFFQPAPKVAPWHVQCVIDMPDGTSETLNFWPHKQKAQREGERSRSGADAAQSVIEGALIDQEALRRDPSAFAVIDV